jgi:hypothetical protein
MIAAVSLALGLPLLALAGLAAYRVSFLRWYVRQIAGNGYFGRTRAGRDAFKSELRERSRLLVAIAGAVRRVRKPRHFGAPRVRGIQMPPMVPKAEWERAIAYRPEKRDVFVATQMKCGTTWMQQIVYEVLSRGRGDLGDAGHRHLYAMSPWIESQWSVRMADAPRIGSRGSRVVKTHLPASLCPFDPAARYVYVTRHPVACFASSVDFVRMLLGPMTPELPDLVEWFCSDRMWWGPWPAHVAGFWDLAQRHPQSVLFLHYEELRTDLPAAVDRTAAFLDVALAPDERAAVVAKSSFDYMKANEELFEMSPPTPLMESEGSFLHSARTDRNASVGPAERERIVAFCREGLRGTTYPVARFYPDLS